MGEVLMHPIDGAGSDAATVNGHTVESNVPADAKFTDTTYPVFAGATASENGTTGLVPEPTIEDADKYLCGDGTWKTVSGGTGTSDSPVEVLIIEYPSITDGTIEVYRIGHLLHIVAGQLSVNWDKRSSIQIFGIGTIDGFSFKRSFSCSTWVAAANSNLVSNIFGIALASPDNGDSLTISLIGDPDSPDRLQTGIFFSMTVPLLDDKL